MVRNLFMGVVLAATALAFFAPLQLPGRHKHAGAAKSHACFRHAGTSLEFGFYLSTIETFSLRRTHLSSHGAEALLKKRDIEKQHG